MLLTIEPKLREATLVQAAQSGDRVAFGTLYHEYGKLVHGALLARVSPQDAEDLMQDVFIKALEQLPSLREPGAFGGWLISIARRTAIDYMRTGRRTIPIPPSLAETKRTGGEAFMILANIQKLPESYRETLILRLVEGMTGPEIASRTGHTPDSIRVNLHRGMKLLRDQLKEVKRV